VASRLYKTDITWPWTRHVQSCRYTQDESTIVQYIIEVLRPFPYCTLWMSNRHTVILHHVVTVYNHMFDHIDGIIQPLDKKITSWTQDLYFAVKLANQKLSKYYAEVTPMMGMLVSSAHILDPFHKVQAFRKCDKGIDINSEDETSYTNQYQETFLKYVENKYCVKYRRVQIIQPECVTSNHVFAPGTAAASGQSSFH